MFKIKPIIGTMRLPFLVLTPMCIFLAWSPIWAKNIDIQNHLFILTFIGAIMAHISVNMLNEYLDFKSGLDLNTIRTPFSGGSGALPNNPYMAKTVLSLSLITLFITLLIGLFFVWMYAWQLLSIGLLGLLLIVAYTRWINQHPWLCLIAPGLGFGVLMVIGANFAVSGVFDSNLYLVSLLPFFLVNNLLGS
jgi:1,4-dihydroxy-2-naphthoate octaprenyltransferase